MDKPVNAKSRTNMMMVGKKEFFDLCTNKDLILASKYNEKEHISLLYDVFNNFGGRTEFLQVANIAEETFSRWLRNHPNFKLAYEKAKELSFHQWETLPLKEKDINHTYWQVVMRNRFNYGKPKLTKADGKNPVEMLDGAISQLKEGKLTLIDVKNVADIAEKRVGIESKVKVEKQQDNLADRLTSEQRLQLKSWLDDTQK